MNDLASAKLCEIVARYGQGVCDEPRKLRALLIDLCPGMPRQVNTLVAAAEQQVVSEMRGSATTVPWSILAGRLVRRLVEETAMAESDAQWVVAAWGKALGRADAVTEAPLPIPPPSEGAASPGEPASVEGIRGEPVFSKRDERGRRFGRGVLVGSVLLAAVALGGWLAYRFLVSVPPLDCTGKDGVNAADMRKVQEAWAKKLGRPVEETVELGRNVAMTFVLVPPGKFRMGSPENEKGRAPEETLHEVTLTEPFYLGKYEVTQAQYVALWGAPEQTVKNPSRFGGPQHPVEQISWDEAREAAAQLTKKQGEKLVYRLPTEAEWEYACRAGRPASLPFGLGSGVSLSEQEANINGYLDEAHKATCAVGSYPANALGLFDMHGNVWEWCADYFAPYPSEPALNPTGPPEGSRRVARGGCWIAVVWSCRAAARGRYEPGERHRFLGFRLAYSVPSAEK